MSKKIITEPVSKLPVGKRIKLFFAITIGFSILFILLILCANGRRIFASENEDSVIKISKPYGTQNHILISHPEAGIDSIISVDRVDVIQYEK